MRARTPRPAVFVRAALHLPPSTLRTDGVRTSYRFGRRSSPATVSNHPEPQTAGAAWLRLLGHVGHWELLGYGYFVLRERGTGRFVEEAGLADFHRDLDPPLGVPEAGFALMPWAHGRGLATEALQTVLAWGDTVLRAPRTACLVSPDHAAPQRVVRKCGLTRVRGTVYKGAPTVVYERVAARS